VRKIIYLLELVFIALLISGCSSYQSEQSERHLYCEKNRYQIYFMETGAGGANISNPLLLDTKTGKIWIYTISSHRFVGITVEGLAYSSADSKDFYNQIQNMELNDIPQKDVKQMKDNIFAKFSYILDSEKISEIFKDYRKNKK
jgi:hypothetical protein